MSNCSMLERSLRPITKQIMKNCIGIFQSYNDVRNNASFAHENEVVNKDEGRSHFRDCNLDAPLCAGRRDFSFEAVAESGPTL